MKKTINYYYGLYVNDYKKIKNNYYFNDGAYLLYQIENLNLNLIYLSNSLLSKIFLFYQIILTKYNQYFIIYNNCKYVLIKLNDTIFNYNNLIQLVNFKLPNNLEYNATPRWNILWKDKIDNMEYQFTQSGLKYPIIRQSFNYFLGLAENALIIAEQENLNLKLAICHKRINSNFDFYNPLNLTVDLRFRDICEYFKYCFFNDIKFYSEFNFFINNNGLNNAEKKLFFARMLFPTYYFDLFEKIIKNELKEDKLKKIINKINDYEQFLYKLYRKFRCNLYIDWLENFNQH